MKNADPFCDPETGVCKHADLDDPKSEVVRDENREIIYVGDPMCSWCWGISNHLKSLKANYPEYKFSIVLGGLRPGGGNEWNDQFKDFLRHHWEEVTNRSGQPFGKKLFDRPAFNYDTEPPCRAVVSARKWVRDQELEFFEAVSHKFYVENEDPGEKEFYRSICDKFDIPFDDFISVFESDEMKNETRQDFMTNRNWGVKGYPTVLFKSNEALFQINHGYSEFDDMKRVIEKIINEESIPQ